MLLEVVLLYFLANFAASKPQGASTDRPQPSRPFYRPNPTYELISQLIPPGEPWPANVADYGLFSQTKPPNYTPLWAAASAVATTITTRKPPVDTTTNAFKPSPTVNLEDRIRETERPVDYGWLWPGEEESTSKKVVTSGEKKEEKATSENVDYENVVSTVIPVHRIKDTGTLFTSAPALLNAIVDDDEPKLENVFPVNLIPEVAIDTFKPPAIETTTEKCTRPDPQQLHQYVPVGYFGFSNQFYRR